MPSDESSNYSRTSYACICLLGRSFNNICHLRYEHLSLLKEVANRRSRSNLTINIEKSHFCLKQIPYLGYIVDDGILKVNDEKTRPIIEYEQPKTIKELRRFLGVVGWYRRFIHDFATIATPLTELLKKSKKFDWCEKATQAFSRLKYALTTPPVLINPDYSKHFYLQCDALAVCCTRNLRTDLNIR